MDMNQPGAEVESLAENMIERAKQLQNDAQKLLTRAEILTQCGYDLRTAIDKERRKAEARAVEMESHRESVADAIGSAK